jgi:hypothetical protein
VAEYLSAEPPHAYIPVGPVQCAPLGSFRSAQERQEAFAAVLEGVGLGAYDERMIEWLASWDDPTCRTIASLMWRCRLAGAYR